MSSQRKALPWEIDLQRMLDVDLDDLDADQLRLAVEEALEFGRDLCAVTREILDRRQQTVTHH
jgi:hypothetical protein